MNIKLKQTDKDNKITCIKEKNMLKVAAFEDLKVTTITMVVTLMGDVNITAAFLLMPITKIEVKQLRESSKCQLPHCKIPGSILSMRHRNMTRGIIRNKKQSFKNAVTIDLSTKRKNISVKLSTNSMQICGASSRQDGIEAAKHIIDHLHKIQNVHHKMHNEPEKCQEAIDWILQQTKGESIIKEQFEYCRSGKVELKISKQIPENNVNLAVDLDKLPEDIDRELVEVFLSMGTDQLYHSDLRKKIEFLRNLDKIVDDELKIDHVDEAMVNYNYKLGFEVDRAALNKLIENRNGFVSRYNNAFSPAVSVELPYTPTKNTKIKRRKNKVPHHTFLVYRYGTVTQSGPGGELMKDAYYLFMETIKELYNEIVYDPAKALASI